MIQEIRINGQRVDYDFGELGYRLNKFAQSATNFSQKGGDYSTTVTFPLTKHNTRVFGVSTHLSGINKFNRTKNFIGEIFIDGIKVFNGVFKLTQISIDGYEGDFISDNIHWVDMLDSISLQNLGYVNGEPTWTTPFLGAATINQWNPLNNTQTDLLAPTLVYNNTPKTDYFDFEISDIHGVYDTAGNQLTSPLNFPDAFLLQNGFFGLRQGLTFEDFPPAIYYPNLLKKIFDNIGWTIGGEIFQEEWFNKLYMPYTGTGYKYNWKTLAYLYAEPTNRVVSSGDFIDAIKEDFDLYEDSDTTNRPNLGINIMNRVGFVYQNIGTTDSIPDRIDHVTNFKKYLAADRNGEYICPASGRYRIRLKSKVAKQLMKR